MAKWKHILDLKDVWGQAQNNEITTAELIEAIMKRVKALNIVDGDTISDNWVTDIMLDFEELLDIGDVDKDDFDYVWENFYNWADSERVWVKTSF